MTAVPTPDPHELVGAILSRKYALKRVIGSGGMGTVFESTSPDRDRWAQAYATTSGERADLRDGTVVAEGVDLDAVLARAAEADHEGRLATVRRLVSRFWPDVRPFRKQLILGLCFLFRSSARAWAWLALANLLAWAIYAAARLLLG